MKPTILNVKLIPNASKSEVVGWEGDCLKVRVNAIPEKGKANAALLKLLAHYFHLPVSSFSLIGGLTSRKKRVLIEAEVQVKR